MNPLTLALIGPTASGKSEFAMALAAKLGAEIVCLDSTTVYRGFNIGTAKPSAEQQAKVPHHLVDILEPGERFDAHAFIQRAQTTAGQIAARGKIPLFVGGSYFYLRSLEHGMYPTGGFDESKLLAIEDRYTREGGLDTQAMHAALQTHDPVAAQSVHPHDRFRLVRALALVEAGHQPSRLRPTPGLKTLWLKYALITPRAALHQAIGQRVDSMLASGLVEETRSLMDRYPGARALGAIGYRECMRCLLKQSEPKDLKEAIVQSTRQLAKKQMTWLRADPSVRFVDAGDGERIELEVSNLKAVLQ